MTMIKVSMLLLALISISIDRTEARFGFPASIGSVILKGPRDRSQCSCHKTCNPKNDICYSRSLCWACYLNGTTDGKPDPEQGLAPSAADAGFIFSSELASRKCNCRKVCNPGSRHCYSPEACTGCQQGIAPATSAPVRKCSCRKTCNPDHHNACFDEDVCYECVMGRAPPPNSD